jgi:hypothetical protein
MGQDIHPFCPNSPVDPNYIDADEASKGEPLMRKGRRLLAALLGAGLMAGSFASVPAAADHNEDDHSKNVKLLTRKPIKISKDLFAQGSDLAFQGNLLLAGTYEGTGFFRIKKGAPYIKQIGFHDCPGSQGDVSVWGNLAFVSIDSAGSNNRTSPVCNNTNESQDKEGVRIINIKNPARARQVGFVETDCGSHTHTLVPHNGRLFLYIQSYPLGAPTATCSPASHRKISVIEINKSKPSKSKVATTPSVNPSIGCHDVTYFPKKDLAAAACISENQIWSIDDPKNPEILAHVPNPPGMQIAHSSSFTWDGKYVIFSDEYAGAAGGGGCAGEEDSPVGAMYFYDISDPASPQLQSWHSLPRVPSFDNQDEAERFRCTTHNYSVLPYKDKNKYRAVSSYYMGGMSEINFDDPTNPSEIAHYVPANDGVPPDMWSAYWYNGLVYTNDHSSRLGLHVFKIKGLDRKQVRYFKGRFNPQTQIPSFK